MRASTRKSTAVIAVLITAIVCALLAWIFSLAFQPPPGRPDISIAFLGYTNDSTGTLLAKVAVTNRGSSAVIRGRSGIEVPAPAEPGRYTFDRFLPGGSTLGGGASEEITFPVPTNQPQWRFSTLVYPDLIPSRVVKGTAAELLRAVGMKPRYRVVFYGFQSDWIDTETSSNTGSVKP